LEQRFNEASRKLDDKARASGAVKERAENLRDKAIKLAENAKAKLENIQGMRQTIQFSIQLIILLLITITITEMEDRFHENERRLNQWQKIIDELNEQMMSHLIYIEERSTFYRNCQG
jgi:hypothetical protein